MSSQVDMNKGMRKGENAKGKGRRRITEGKGKLKGFNNCKMENKGQQSA
jgi:hypothetical protein